MKRLVISLVGCYILIAIGLSLSISQTQNHSAQPDSWPTIKITLPFNKQDLEDASYDNLMAIGTLVTEYFTNTFDTLGKIAMWSNEKLIATEQKIADITNHAQVQSRALAAEHSNRTAPNIFASAKTTILATIIDTQQLFSEFSSRSPSYASEQFQRFAQSIKNNFHAVTQVASLANDLRAPPSAQVLGHTTATKDLPVAPNNLVCVGTLYYEKNSSDGQPLYYIDRSDCGQ